MKSSNYPLFYLLSFTWGIIMSFIGCIVAVVLLAMGYEPKRFHCMIYFEVGSGWGGVNLGCFFIVQKGSPLSRLQHESGHGLQNATLGVFMPFVVAIPSAIRYWYRKYKINKGLGYTLPEYDSIWFEGSATALGKKYFPEK